MRSKAVLAIVFAFALCVGAFASLSPHSSGKANCSILADDPKCPMGLGGDDRDPASHCQVRSNSESTS